MAVVDGLTGTWTLRRTVEDVLTGRTGHVRGELTVTEAGDRLRLQETGTLHWGGRDTPVERTTYLQLHDGEVWATFADGGLFHPWRPGEDVVHPCAEDTYVGRVELDTDPPAATMRTTWHVTGPAKDQLLRTELRRR